MRIGLASDTHGDPTAWRKAALAMGEVELICHAGDVLYHGVFNPVTDTYHPRGLAEALNRFPVPVIHARGNCDSEVDQLALDNHILSDFAVVSAEGTRILVCHGHKWTDEQLIEMARRGKMQVVHRGHTHVPEIALKEGVLFVNAGSCALPKQEPAVPTVGLLEDGHVSIVEVDSGKVCAEGEVPA